MVESFQNNTASQEVVDFLKNLKLKSRASFLHILEFIPPKFADYRLSELKDMLNLLSPIGG